MKPGARVGLRADIPIEKSPDGFFDSCRVAFAGQLMN